MDQNLLRNYLAWQGEIGSDEVVLPEPWIRKPPQGKTVPSSSVSERAFQHAPAFQSTSPANVFGNLAREFEMATTTEKPSVPTPTKIARPIETMALPAFAGMAEFWEYLDQNGRSLFAAQNDVHILRGTGNLNAPLALVSLEPSAVDATEGRLFAGEAGLLLEKMMRAIHLDYANLYRTSLLRHHAPSRVWSRREITRILPLLHVELAFTKIPVVLILGESCAQAVLKTTKTMEELRQIPHREGGRDFVVTYHPNDLLLRDEWKRKAWEDLQWLQRRMTHTQAQA